MVASVKKRAHRRRMLVYGKKALLREHLVVPTGVKAWAASVFYSENERR